MHIRLIVSEKDRSLHSRRWIGLLSSLTTTHVDSVNLVVCCVCIVRTLTAQLFLCPQTSIKVQIPSSSAGASYQLQWKEYNVSWNDAGSKSVTAQNVEAEPLQPGTTYCLRLVAAGSSEPGPELIVDTEQVGCTPQAKQGCCEIL